MADADRGAGGPFYGDLRVGTDRRQGACLFWVVPDVAPGFHVPAFYENFVRERREHVQFKVDKREQMMQQERMRPPPPPGMDSQGGKSNQ